ncbi:MAG: low molecular weight phosphotyrosine protein phosphatase [Cyclobacteriaceae bacterium]|nr:low molecular weight phosphotyrosine protein phosphatase [Cyclobacteriaceae bacterium]
MKKILFVCLGNICRSPLAEALFRKHVEANGLQDQFMCDSCGTADYHIGSAPDQRSVANARENGLDYSHRGRQLSEHDFKEFDYIVAMDESNLANIQRRNEIGHANIFKMRDFDSDAKGADVPDPYFGGISGFQDVFDILDRSTLNLLEELTESSGIKIS